MKKIMMSVLVCLVLVVFLGMVVNAAPAPQSGAKFVTPPPCKLQVRVIFPKGELPTAYRNIEITGKDGKTICEPVYNNGKAVLISLPLGGYKVVYMGVKGEKLLSQEVKLSVDKATKIAFVSPQITEAKAYFAELLKKTEANCSAVQWYYNKNMKYLINSNFEDNFQNIINYLSKENNALKDSVNQEIKVWEKDITDKFSVLIKELVAFKDYYGKLKKAIPPLPDGPLPLPPPLKAQLEFKPFTSDLPTTPGGVGVWIGSNWQDSIDSCFKNLKSAIQLAQQITNAPVVLEKGEILVQ
jgi:hypothetical protein